MKISIDEYISRQQDGQVLDEAFKAGNRARKKESARDTVGETNPLVDTLLNEINTENLVRRYLEKNRFLTVHATFRDIILHVLGRLTNVERGVLNHCLQVYTYQQSGGEFGVIHFRTMGSFKTKLDDDRLIFEIKEDEPAKMVADFFERVSGGGSLLLHIDTHEARLGESYVTAAGIGFCLKIVEMFNRFREGNDIYEAFRAGNRARRKESAQDAVGETSVISPQVVSDCVDDAINRCVSDFGSPHGIIKGVRLSLFVTEFARYLFTELTGSRYASEYLKIGSVPLNDDDTAGDIWIEFWGTTHDRNGVKYSPRWMVSWYVKDGSAVYKITYGTGADHKEYHRSILFTINDDCSWTPGDGLMIFAEAFAVKTRELWDGGMLVPQHPVDEAFRAGNKARKKESAQDTVDSIDDVQAQIDLFKKQTDIELEIRDGRPYFGEYLDLTNCTGLTSLPAGLEVNGFLSLHGCTGLTHLPADLEVEGDLYLEGCTGLTRLPDGLKIRGGLFLYRCTGLTGLPSDLVVQGTWIVHKGILTPFFRKLGIPVDENGDTKAEDWHEWQKAHGYLTEAFRAGNKARKKESAQDTVESVNDIQAQIDKFREQTGIELEIRDGRPYFDKGLDLDCTGLTSLPDGLDVNGFLTLDGCTGLTELPTGLEVNGYLSLEGCTGLTSLPDGLKVKGNWYLRNCTKLTRLPAGLRVGGLLDLTGCTGLTSLPADLKVNKVLNLRDCTGLTSLPAGLEVGKDLDLRGCTGLTGLPAGLKVGGELWLTNSGLTSLPSDLVVQGWKIKHHNMLTPFFEKLGIPVDEDGDTKTSDWHKWQRANGYLTEAFRAGNHARKKESVADTVQGHSIEITCREAVAKLAEFLREPVKAPWDPHEKTSRCMDEDGLDEAIEAAEPAPDTDDPYSFEFGISGYSGYYYSGFNFNEDSPIYISICEDYVWNDKGVKDKSAGMIQKVNIGCNGVGSENGSFDLLKQGRSDSKIYGGMTELTPATFASLMELCRVLFPLKGNDSRLSYFIGGGNGAECVHSYGAFLYANQDLLWPWLCQEDRMLVYEIEDELNTYYNDDCDVDEAFRAGNRARKKETVQDAVQEVESPLEKQIKRFEEETGRELNIVDGRPFTVGPLNLNGIDTLTRLPDGLHVDYYCCISNCPNIEAIPRGLSTRTGALNADHCKNLRYVPADIRINNTIYFDHCPSLESLPEGLKVYRGGIDLSHCTALKSLPENFEVNGPLKVTGCKNLKTLPKGLSVDCLECEHSGLTELPLDIRFKDKGLWAFLRPNTEVSRFFHKITGVTFDLDKQPLMKEIWCRWQQEHGYVDYGIDLSKPVDINEGGKAVKGVSPIRGDLALTVANKAASALMQQLPGVKIVPVGSVGKKPADQESGDIDLAVQVPWEQKDLVIQAVQKLVPDAECREFKALWLVSAPWPWREDGLYGRVQLDMFLGPDIRLTQFMRWSPNLAKGESRYKGLYRTALLISIASCIPAEGKQDVKFDGSDCLKDCWRYSLSPRTGLRIVHKTWASKTGKMLKNPKNVDEDTVIVAVDPQIIAVKLLGEGATLNDCVSLESVWKRMQSPQFPYKQYQDQILKEYYKYLQDAGEELPAMKQNEDNTDVKKD